MNNREVKVLLVEDSEQDALLARIALEDSGLTPDLTCVDNEDALREALRAGTWDIVLADYSLPRYSGLAALKLAKTMSPDTPVILVSGAIGDEAVVEVMKAGAADYLLKQNLGRLGVLVERQLAEAAVAKERQAAEALIRERDNRRSKELLKLAEASLAINAAQTLEDLMQIGTTRAAEIIEAHQAVTSLSVDDNWAQAINAVYLTPKYDQWKGYQARPSGNGTCREVCRTNKPMRMTQAELEAHPDWRGFAEEATRHPPMRGWLAAPLTGRDGQNLGLIQLSDKVTGDFTADDEAVLVQIAQILSVAVENVRLFEETKRAYEDAKCSNKMKDEFLATLSHELRTPLNAVLGHAELLELEEPGSVEYKESLEAIKRNARAQNELISELLDVSRIITGKLALDVTEVDLAPLLREGIASMRFAAEAKGITLTLTIEPDIGPIRGDAGRLRQVMWNLLSNAIKFTKNGGRVEVALKRSNSKILIDVADTGEGIAPSFIPYVFERFRQEDGSLTRAYGGLGLGLAIVRHIIELHGGMVLVESAGKGKGATFTVCLPPLDVRPRDPATVEPSEEVEQESARDELGVAIRSKACDLSGLRVLVVDDQKDARDVVARVLKQAGAAVECGASAAEGLWLAKTGRFDIFLFDIGMPEEDGNELVQNVRALEGKVALTPAIALTAYVRGEDQTKAIRSGFQLHLAKPVQPAVLVRSVAKMAGR